jgi:serralysin
MKADLVVSYPRVAEVGKRYALTIDLTHDVTSWSFDTEEYAVHCVVEASPAFSCQPEGDASLVVHRFGGTYGPARFVLSANQVAESSRIRITLLSARGLPLRTRDLDDVRVVPAAPVVEAPAPKKQRVHGVDDWGIAIGLKTYKNAPLQAPHLDATAFYEWMVSPSGGAVPREQAVLYCDGDGAPNAIGAEAALMKISLRDPAAPSRRLYVFAAGHGMESVRGPVLAVEGSRGEIKGVDLCDYAQNILSAGRFDEVVLFLDADRTSGVEVDFSSSVSLPRAVSKSAPRWLFGFATARGQAGFEIHDQAGVMRSPFAMAVLEGLSGEAADRRGAIMSGGLASFVTQRTAELARTRLKAEQHPTFEIAGEIEIAPPQPELAQEARTSPWIGKLGPLNLDLWPNGSTLHARFLDGSPALHKRVADAAKEWSKYANLYFDFGSTDPDAPIRISFKQDGAWSYRGTTALTVKPNEPTMNFGWLTETSPDEDLRRVVLHEFGELLGLVNETQNPNARIPWNEPVVLKELSGPPNNWSAHNVQQIMFSTYRLPHGPIEYRAFDRSSIMMHPIAAHWTLDGQSFDQPSELSSSDKDFIARLYPQDVHYPADLATRLRMTLGPRAVHCIDLPEELHRMFTVEVRAHDVGRKLIVEHHASDRSLLWAQTTEKGKLARAVVPGTDPGYLRIRANEDLKAVEYSIGVSDLPPPRRRKKGRRVAKK